MSGSGEPDRRAPIAASGDVCGGNKGHCDTRERRPRLIMAGQSTQETRPRPAGAGAK